MTSKVKSDFIRLMRIKYNLKRLQAMTLFEHMVVDGIADDLRRLYSAKRDAHFSSRTQTYYEGLLRKVEDQHFYQFMQMPSDGALVSFHDVLIHAELMIGFVVASIDPKMPQQQMQMIVDTFVNTTFNTLMYSYRVRLDGSNIVVSTVTRR